MTALRLRGLYKSYAAATPVLQDISLTVAAGEIFALLGPSGSGKTTLVKMIAGFETPDRGDIEIAGVSCLGQAPERRGAVLVFQDLLLFPHLNVADNIGFGLKMRGVPGPDRAAKVAEMTGLLQLRGLELRKPTELSGGQQQRVALARALAVAPDILLLDEPMSGLDRHLREEMGQTILDLQRRTGVTIVMITHDQAEAATLADRIGVVLGGRIAQQGTPRDLFDRPESLAVAQFLGGRNFLEGVRKGDVFETAIGRFALPAPQGEAAPPQGGVLTIRPEAVILAAVGHAGPTDENTLEARVAEARYTGNAVTITLQTDAPGTGGEGPRLYAQLSPQDATDLRPGDQVLAQLPRSALWVLPRPD